MQEWLDSIANAPDYLKFFIIAVSTLISEDLTCISTGTFIAKEIIHPVTGILACFVGIFVGDGLLYFVGLLVGKRALKLPIIRSILSEKRVDQCKSWFESNGFKAVLISRFVPGTRLPTYFAAGLLGSRAKYFLLSAALATALWTPLIVLAAWLYGEQLEQWLEFSKSKSALAVLISVVSAFLVFKLLIAFSDWRKRRRIRSRLYRLVRWEFWPIIVVYFPVVFYNLWLVFKYRRFNLFLGSNPGIDFSGMVGESKHQIMSLFQGQEDYVATFGLIPPAQDIHVRIEVVEAWLKSNQLTFPVIFKPDVGQRGSGVKRIDDLNAARTYLEHNHHSIQIQAFVPGPYEFGVYYIRYPNQPEGKIIGLTGKDFPQVVGNGKTNLETLILKNPVAMGRYHIFLHRFKACLESIPKPGEVIHLVNTGNHCLGTIFNDSTHLLTDALQARFNEITHSAEGIFIGRYDIRASNLEGFRLGKAFKILEFNGATCEPAHMYDLRHGFFFAIRCLCRHYAALWEIGYQNTKRGIPIPKISQLIRAFLHAKRLEKAHPKAEER